MICSANEQISSISATVKSFGFIKLRPLSMILYYHNNANFSIFLCYTLCMNTVYVSRFSYFKPSPENAGESPKLEYVEPLFKRRFSQISKMTIQVVHDVLAAESGAVDGATSPKLSFMSFRGELSRQLKINKGLVLDADVMPAQFSLSVFNTPPAVATIALGIKAGYTAVFPGNDDFYAGLLCACAPILCGAEKKIVFVYADECVPDEYRPVFHGSSPDALAFACVLGGEKSAGAKEIFVTERRDDFSSPQSFLDFLCKAN